MDSQGTLNSQNSLKRRTNLKESHFMILKLQNSSDQDSVVLA